MPSTVDGREPVEGGRDQFDIEGLRKFERLADTRLTMRDQDQNCAASDFDEEVSGVLDRSLRRIPDMDASRDCLKFERA